MREPRHPNRQLTHAAQFISSRHSHNASIVTRGQSEMVVSKAWKEPPLHSPDTKAKSTSPVHDERGSRRAVCRKATSGFPPRSQEPAASRHAARQTLSLGHERYLLRLDGVQTYPVFRTRWPQPDEWHWLQSPARAITCSPTWVLEACCFERIGKTVRIRRGPAAVTGDERRTRH